MDPRLYSQMREMEDHHWWFRGRRQVVQRMLSRYLEPDSHRLLDVGCGTGGNLTMLSQFGEVSGIELDEHARELAQQRKVAEVLSAHLPDQLPAFESPFDAVVMLDVLEHLDEDVASLAALKELMAKDGVMLLTVPAFPFLWSAHDEVHHHKRRYRRESLTRVVEQAGLKVEYISYFNSALFPAVAAVRIMQRLFGQGKQQLGDLSLPPAPVNSALEGLFAAERHLLGPLSLPFGVSLLAVIKQ